MAIVVYKCDTCKREKEFLQDVEGMENIQRCTITHGCRGKLFQVNILPDYVRASAPERVLGLNDWRQRKVLYNHVQGIASDTWLLEHNLGVYPSISVFVNIPIEGDPENIVEIAPTDINVVDDNNIILVFDRAWSGIAQLVARQSDPDLLRPFTRTLEGEGITLQQISNSGEIAIATKASTIGLCSDIYLTVSYTTTRNTIIEETYLVSDNLTNSVSPWRDLDTVVIKGQIYVVRSFQGITAAMHDETIGTGSTFRFTQIEDCPSGSPPAATPHDIQQDEAFILFATKPFDLVDKVTTQYVDIFDITETENTFALLYDSGEFFAESTVIQDTYPPIRAVIT